MERGERGRLIVLGLGLRTDDIPPGNMAAIKEAKQLVLQTERCDGAQALRDKEIPFCTLDELYERAEDFDIFRQEAARFILMKMQGASEGDLCFAVPGSPEGLPLLGEIRRQAAKAGVPVIVRPAVGYAEAALAFHMGEAGYEEMAGRCYANALPPRFDTGRPLCVLEIDNLLLAGELKLALLDMYPATLRVYLYHCCDGRMEEREIKLEELDRQGLEGYDHSSTLLLPAIPFEEKERYSVEDLYQVLLRLREPGGCPWDREQTHQSLRGALLEEAYEVADAIDSEDDDALCEELGDLLLQIFFHTMIGEEQGAFGYHDVSSGISQKMIHRHPHVFGGAALENSAEVLNRWEEIKRKEKQQRAVADTLEAVPRAFPALMRAAKLQKRAANVGFDWKTIEGALAKTTEEREEWLAEWRRKKAGENVDGRLELEMGDWLFSLVNVARMAGIDSEQSLQRSNDKFMKRFTAMETAIQADGGNLEEMDLDAMDEYWERVKKDRG